MKNKAPRNKFEFLLICLQNITLLAGAMQLFIDTNPTNILSTLAICVATIALVQYLEKSKCYKTHPLSSLILIGFNITGLSAALITQSGYLNPVIFNLRVPELTFSLLPATQIIAILTHWAYRNFSPFTSLHDSLSNGLSRIHLYSTPSIYAVWTMGAIGAYAQLIGYAEIGNASGKIIESMSFLAWMPFAIPALYRRDGAKFCNIRKQLVLLVLFIATMLLIGLARNARQLMFIGPVQLIISYVLYLTQDNKPATSNTLKLFTAGLVTSVAGIILASDLATAMVMAREKRDKVSSGEIIAETFQALTDRTRITAFRDAKYVASQITTYDENYLPNPILARFSETKFHDNIFFFGSSFSDREKEILLTGLHSKIFAILPDALTKRIDPTFEKGKNIYSMGDYYLYTLEGESRLSSFVTGSIWGDLLTFTGIFYPLSVVGTTLVAFVFIDLLSFGRNPIVIAPLAICSGWLLFIYGLGGESIAAKTSMLLREMPQRIILYFIIFFVITSVIGLFAPKMGNKK